MIPDVWPADLTLSVQRSWGARWAVEALGGLSGARVWRLDAGPWSGVVKQCGASEAAFYERLAPTLRAAGINVPELWWSGQDSTGHWLLIEYIPAAPMRSTWLANPDWMRTLARLHRLPVRTLDRLPGLYRPPALEQLADPAAELLPEARRPSFREHLAAIAHLVEPLEAVPISGDPNPANWGLRADGQAVLFDWERAGLGPAAFDLAITMPGLGNAEDAQRIARAYLGVREGGEPGQAAIQELTRAILWCKAWVVAEFMATVVERELALGSGYAGLWEAVPDWVAQVADADILR